MKPRICVSYTCYVSSPKFKSWDSNTKDDDIRRWDLWEASQLGGWPGNSFWLIHRAGHIICRTPGENPEPFLQKAGDRLFLSSQVSLATCHGVFICNFLLWDEDAQEVSADAHRVHLLTLTSVTEPGWEHVGEVSRGSKSPGARSIVPLDFTPKPQIQRESYWEC